MHPRHIPAIALLASLAVAGCAGRAPAPAEPTLATKPTVGQEVGAVADNKIEITFPAGSARLSPQAGQQLDVAARLFRDVGPARMFAAGHTDAQGEEFGNVVLAAQRARAVKQALVARGIPPDRLYIQSVGQSEPISRSDPNAAANRRVVVQWQIL